MDIALKNLARVWVGAIVIGLLSACGGASDQAGNASPGTAPSAAANNSARALPSFLPTTDMPPSARTIAIQIEGGRLNSEELAQTVRTGVLPKPFDGPLLSGAEELSKSIGGNSSGNNSASVAPSFQPRINAQIRAASLTQAYRFYNPRTTAHFFTTNTAERANIIANLSFMNDEGPAFFTSNAMVAGLSPVHRFYNRQTGVHFFTISEGERAKVAAELPQYTYEGIAYYASQVAGADLTPLYRFYYASKGFHFFTSNIAERDSIIATLPNYRYEGVGYYVMNSDWQPTDGPGTDTTGAPSYSSAYGECFNGTPALYTATYCEAYARARSTGSSATAANLAGATATGSNIGNIGMGGTVSSTGTPNTIGTTTSCIAPKVLQGGVCVTPASTPLSMVVSGVASKGILSGANVTAYSISTEGTISGVIGKAISASDGSFSLIISNTDVPNDFLLLKVNVNSGTKMFDEATGQTIDPDVNMELRASGKITKSQTNKMHITALSEIAFSQAERSGLSVTSIERAYSDLGRVFGFDLVKIEPVFLNGKPINAPSTVLSAISYMALLGDYACKGSQSVKLTCVIRKLATQNLTPINASLLQSRIRHAVASQGISSSYNLAEELSTIQTNNTVRRKETTTIKALLKSDSNISLRNLFDADSSGSRVLISTTKRSEASGDVYLQMYGTGVNLVEIPVSNGISMPNSFGSLNEFNQPSISAFGEKVFFQGQNQLKWLGTAVGGRQVWSRDITSSGISANSKLLSVTPGTNNVPMSGNARQMTANCQFGMDSYAIFGTSYKGFTTNNYLTAHIAMLNLNDNRFSSSKLISITPFGNKFDTSISLVNRDNCNVYFFNENSSTVSQIDGTVGVSISGDNGLNDIWLFSGTPDSPVPPIQLPIRQMLRDIGLIDRGQIDYGSLGELVNPSIIKYQVLSTSANGSVLGISLSERNYSFLYEQGRILPSLTAIPRIFWCAGQMLSVQSEATCDKFSKKYYQGVPTNISPDGNRIVLKTGQGFYIFDRRENQVFWLVEPDKVDITGNPLLVNNGNRLLFVVSKGRLPITDETITSPSLIQIDF